MVTDEVWKKIKLFFLGVGAGIVSAIAVILSVLHHNRGPVAGTSTDLDQLQDIGEGLSEIAGDFDRTNEQLQSNTDRFESILNDIKKTEHN